MMTTTSWSIEVGHHESDASAQAVRSKAGSLAIFAAMRRASSRVGRVWATVPLVTASLEFFCQCDRWLSLVTALLNLGRWLVQ
jgi:hypothetical protein